VACGDSGAGLSGGRAEGGEVDLFEHRVERFGLVGELVGGVGAEPADVGAQVRRRRAQLGAGPADGLLTTEAGT